MEFGDQIRNIRKKENLTQEQFAIKFLMSDVFQISLDQLVKGEDHMNNMTEKVIRDGSETRRSKIQHDYYIDRWKFILIR